MDLTIEQWKENLCVIRGGGDIATGIIYKLFQCGFSASGAGNRKSKLYSADYQFL